MAEERIQESRSTDCQPEYSNLAVAILKKAFLDWQRYGDVGICGTKDIVEDFPQFSLSKIPDVAKECHLAYECGFPSANAELVSFLVSDWCRFLIESFDANYEVIMNRIGVKI